MRYFRNVTTNKIFAFDEINQVETMNRTLSEGLWEEVSREVAEAVPPKSVEEQFEDVRVALQHAIDMKAREFGFSGGNALMLYAGFPNDFQPFAQQFATWEVDVWVKAGTYRALVLAGQQPMRTPEQAVEMMPPYPA